MVKIRYALIRSMDISNGRGIGVSLFVQGCRAHCKNCFNQETWSFAGGNEWNDDTKNTFLSLVDQPYVKRVTILGGEPLEQENIDGVIDLLKTIKDTRPDKEVWLYTGHTFENIVECEERSILPYVDVLIDGRFIDELKDISLPWRGSSNQRVIDVKNTLNNNQIVLFNK